MGSAHATPCGSERREADVLSPSESDALEGLQLLAKAQGADEPEAKRQAVKGRCAAPGCEDKADKAMCSGHLQARTAQAGALRPHKRILAKLATDLERYGALTTYAARPA